MLFCIPFLAGMAFSSETIVGTVWNGTTGKPSIGDDIALLTIYQGSLEVSRSQTALDGSFRLRSDAPAHHLLRVRHEGVIYQQEVVGTAPIRLNVFDTVSKADTSVHGTLTIMKMESLKDMLRITELHAIANDSKPPRTVVNPSNIEILIPEKAILELVLISAPSGHPEKVTPKPNSEGSKQLVVGYPLRPGTTQLAISYRLPYSETIALHPRLQYPTQLWSVVFPGSMQFRALDGRKFDELSAENGVHVRALSSVSAGTVSGFVISGQGSLPHTQMPASIAKSPAPAPPASLRSAGQMNTPTRGRASRISKIQLFWMALIGAIVVLSGAWIARALRTTRRSLVESEVQREAA
jgi:hypothetical protein